MSSVTHINRTYSHLKRHWMGMLIVHNGRGKQMCSYATDGESYINSDGFPSFVSSLQLVIYSQRYVFTEMEKWILEFQNVFLSPLKYCNMSVMSLQKRQQHQ